MDDQSPNHFPRKRREVLATLGEDVVMTVTGGEWAMWDMLWDKDWGEIEDEDKGEGGSPKLKSWETLFMVPMRAELKQRIARSRLFVLRGEEDSEREKSLGRERHWAARRALRTPPTFIESRIEDEKLMEKDPVGWAGILLVRMRMILFVGKRSVIYISLKFLVQTYFFLSNNYWE